MLMGIIGSELVGPELIFVGALVLVRGVSLMRKTWR